MQKKTLDSIAKKLKKEVFEGHFEYWDDVLFIGGTAVCFYKVYDTGTYTLITDPEQFPHFCTAAYILRAIANGAECLRTQRCRLISKKPSAESNWKRFDQIA